MKATMKKQHLHAWKTVQSVSSHSFPELDGSKETRPSPFLPFQTLPHQAVQKNKQTGTISKKMIIRLQKWKSLAKKEGKG
jgi:hypothetical protein